MIIQRLKVTLGIFSVLEYSYFLPLEATLPLCYTSEGNIVSDSCLLVTLQIMILHFDCGFDIFGLVWDLSIPTTTVQYKTAETPASIMQSTATATPTLG